MRQEIFNKLVDILSNIATFKRVYKNIIPIWTKVKTMPAVAIANAYETTTRQDISSCRARTSAVIDIYIYAKQSNASAYEDVLSELIEKIEQALNSDKELQGMVVDCLVTGVKQDAGMLHPFAMAQLEVSVSYLKQV